MSPTVRRTPTRGLLPAARLVLPIIGLSCFALATLPARARAYTFQLLGDGASQTLTWFWEGCTTNCGTFGSCGLYYAANGRIPYTSSPPSGQQTGGMLDWTAGTGTLNVVGLVTPRAATQFSGSCAGSWAAVDARGTPLVFALQPQVGDPIPLFVDLQVRPRLLGTINQYTYLGGSAFLNVEMTMKVSIDAQVVASDTFVAQQTLTDDADQVWVLAFPKGTGNYAVLNDISPANDITVELFAYMRGYCTSASGQNSIEAFSAYGAGPAIEILIRDLNAVDVAEDEAPDRVALAVGPNPTASPRIGYALPAPAPVTLTLYDVRGARVATLVDELRPAGRHVAAWDRAGTRLAAGVYLVELRAGDERRVGRLVILGQ